MHVSVRIGPVTSHEQEAFDMNDKEFDCFHSMRIHSIVPLPQWSKEDKASLLLHVICKEQAKIP